MAALLGAEEFAFGTAALVAIGCDMARQCHLDTCPTGIATQREDLRAKFAGTPDDVVRYFTAIAEDLRRELAAAGARSVGEIIGDGRRLLRANPAARAELAPVIGAAPWAASPARRADPSSAGRDIGRAPASALEVGIAAAFRGQGQVAASGLRVTTADRSFGAGLTGALERGELHGPIRLELVGRRRPVVRRLCRARRGAAPRRPGQRLRRRRAWPVARSRSPRSRISPPTRPRRRSPATPCCTARPAGGSTWSAGRGCASPSATAAPRPWSRGSAPHGCEYMTGGTVVVLGPVGANFGAGMTGGRAYLYDPTGRHTAALDVRSVAALRLASAVADRADGPARAGELVALLEAHRKAGSMLAARLLHDADLTAHVWLVEPIPRRRPRPRNRQASRDPSTPSDRPPPGRRPWPHRNPTATPSCPDRRRRRRCRSVPSSQHGAASPPGDRPCVLPIPGTPARKVSPMIHPSDSKAGSASAVRDGRDAPVTCATCGCRLTAGDDAFFHFNPLGGRDARGCRDRLRRRRARRPGSTDRRRRLGRAARSCRAARSRSRRPPARSARALRWRARLLRRRSGTPRRAPRRSPGHRPPRPWRAAGPGAA